MQSFSDKTTDSETFNRFPEKDRHFINFLNFDKILRVYLLKKRLDYRRHTGGPPLGCLYYFKKYEKERIIEYLT